MHANVNTETSSSHNMLRMHAVAVRELCSVLTFTNVVTAVLIGFAGHPCCVPLG